MSWGQPKNLRVFPEHSPFFGLSVADEVTVSAQVMAQPDPLLVDRAIALLQDGTPLVTRSSLGAGQVILFHVTANADWSNLPLSGLFVQMLERLAAISNGAKPSAPDLAGQVWVPVQVLDGFGRVLPADAIAGVDGAALIENPPSAEMPPGLYQNQNRQIARNTISSEAVPKPAAWPSGVSVTGFEKAEEQRLAGWVLLLAAAALILDQLALLALSGRLLPSGRAAAIVVLAIFAAPDLANAQDDEVALLATSATVLAYVNTGDVDVDSISMAGLRGLSATLFQRTAIEPINPIGVDLERDDLAFFPFLYWPISTKQPLPSEEAYAKLNTYLRTGGMILFDTRDADLAVGNRRTPTGEKISRTGNGAEHTST